MSLPEQNSKEWLEWRKSRIGASDVPIILGVSPYCTPRKLWKRKLGFEQEEKMHAGMRWGHENEPRVREQMQINLGMRFDPIVMVNEDLTWMSASLDGWNEEKKVVIEIKSCNAKDHQLAKEGIVPEKYWPQLVWQKLVSKCNEIYYCSSHKEDLAIIDCTDKFDDEYNLMVVEKCTEFYLCLINFEEPPLSEKDHAPIDDPEFGKVAFEWQKCKETLNEAMKQEKYYREKLISFTDDGNCEGYGVKLSRVEQEGRVDWPGVCEFYGITKSDLDKFRKEQIGFWKVSLMKK